MTQTTATKDDRFDEFWAVVPLKQEKKKARRIWDKLTKTTDPQIIIDGMRRYRDDPNRDPEFTKYPTTWLNAGCWEDDPLPPRRGYSQQSAPGRMSNAETTRQLREHNAQTSQPTPQPTLEDWFTQQAIGN